MKVMNKNGAELFSAELQVSDKGLGTRIGIDEKTIELELPEVEIAFENAKDGLLVHACLSELDPVNVLIEYDDIKALRAIPGKGLVSFALKAFR